MSLKQQELTMTWRCTAILAESIVAYLTKEGFVCEVANTYWQADEKVRLHQYDCTIVDLMLPGGEGYGLIQTLKKIAISTGIIIISARNALEDKIKGLEIGSDDYLTKPLNKDVLVKILNRWLDRAITS